MRQWQLSALASVGLVAALAASLYAFHEHGGVGFQLMPLEFMAAVGAGWAIGRWWALGLAFAVVPLIAVAPFAGETDSDGVTIRTLGLVFGWLLALWPLLGLALGVGGRKLAARRRIAGEGNG